MGVPNVIRTLEFGAVFTGYMIVFFYVIPLFEQIFNIQIDLLLNIIAGISFVAILGYAYLSGAELRYGMLILSLVIYIFFAFFVQYLLMIVNLANTTSFSFEKSVITIFLQFGVPYLAFIVALLDSIVPKEEEQSIETELIKYP